MRILLNIVTVLLVATVAQAKTGWNFEKTKPGTLPAGWRIETTNSRGQDAVWKVVRDKHAPSGGQVLTLTDAKGNSGSTFNLCWTPKPDFLNGTLIVHFRANTGKEDEGGGIMWRVKDKNNYYVARFNPLEDNFRLYYVKNSRRHMLATAKVHLPAHKWHTMKILVKGDRFQAFLNGKKYLDVHDGTFKKAGGTGLWTKADAATSFDDFTVDNQ